MLRSLHKQCEQAHVFVLCMDAQTQFLLELLELPGVTYLSLSEIEDEKLLAVKPKRSMAEYCWTLSPCLPLYLLHKNTDIDFITYLDADLYFYSSLQPLFDEIGDASIVIIEHRFPSFLKHLEVNGRFCVEWVSFKRDKQGMACLSRWKEQCIEWCFHRLEEGRMGDQKYLDEWPRKYSNLYILQHLGAGVAPWNYMSYRFEKRDIELITVNDMPLIFYHFHQFQLLSNGKFDRISNFYRTLKQEPEAIYSVYEKALGSVLGELRQLQPNFSNGMKSAFYVKFKHLAKCLPPYFLKQLLKLN